MVSSPPLTDVCAMRNGNTQQLLGYTAEQKPPGTNSQEQTKKPCYLAREGLRGREVLLIVTVPTNLEPQLAGSHDQQQL